MTASVVTMTEGSGEQATRARRNRMIAILVTVALMGGIAGGLVGGSVGAGGLLSDSIPAWAAILASVLLVGAILVGGKLYARQLDELERRHRYAAAKTTLGAYMLVYIPWYLLWRGGLLPEPNHEILFVFIYFMLIGSYFWHRRFG